MTRQEIFNAHDEFDRALREHQLTKSTPADLDRFALALVSEPARDPAFQPALAMRLQAIQHVQMTRLLAEMERRNNSTQFWFMVLAIGSIAVGSVSAVAGWIALFEH